MVNKDPFLKQAMEELGHLKEDPDFERILESRADWLRDQYSYCKQAEREGTKKGLEKGMKEGVKEGIKEGIKEGMKEGLERGIQQGMQQGMQQGNIQGKKEVAKKLLAMQMDLEKIMEVTGLSEQQIKSM